MFSGKRFQQLRLATAVLAAVGVGALAIFKIRQASARRTFAASLTTQEKGKVYLHTYPRPPNTCGMSGPTTKLELFLRFNKIPYELVDVMGPENSPSETIPFVSYNGQLTGDSQIVLEFLEKEFKTTMDKSLTPEQHAYGKAIRRMTENFISPNCYRQNLVDNVHIMRDFLYENRAKIGVPGFLVSGIANHFRKGLIKSLNASGIGDMSDERYQQELITHLQALETLLTGKKFLFGDTPSTYDCTVFGVLYTYSLNVPKITNNAAPAKFFAESKVLNGFLRGTIQTYYPEIKLGA